jgi:hypothetical protein
MRAFTELLERHVPYASHHLRHVVCLTCLNPAEGNTCGEYATAADWATHIEAELRAAGLKITRRKPAPEPEQGALI